MMTSPIPQQSRKCRGGGKGKAKPQAGLSSGDRQVSMDMRIFQREGSGMTLRYPIKQ